MKIDQLAFIKNLVIKKKFIEYNARVISMMTWLPIKILELDDHNKTNLHIYQRLIKKLIYLVYKIRPDITFVIG